MANSVSFVKCKRPRCGNKWLPRVENPKRCPKCGSYSWKIKKRDSND